MAFTFTKTIQGWYSSLTVHNMTSVVCFLCILWGFPWLMDATAEEALDHGQIKTCVCVCVVGGVSAWCQCVFWCDIIILNRDMCVCVCVFVLCLANFCRFSRGLIYELTPSPHIKYFVCEQKAGCDIYNTSHTDAFHFYTKGTHTHTSAHIQSYIIKHQP